MAKLETEPKFSDSWSFGIKQDTRKQSSVVSLSYRGGAMNNYEVFSVVWDTASMSLWMVINKVHQDKPGRSSQEKKL